MKFKDGDYEENFIAHYVHIDRFIWRIFSGSFHKYTFSTHKTLI
jgi:hypothetical protein